jgi:hypothetical protein
MRFAMYKAVARVSNCSYKLCILLDKLRMTNRLEKKFSLVPKLAALRRSALYLSPFSFYLLPMSAEPPPYNPLYIKAWILLSLVLSVIFFGMFVFGQMLLHAGHAAWDLIRWLASPII